MYVKYCSAYAFNSFPISESDEYLKVWLPYESESSFNTTVELPLEKSPQGFDVASFSVHTSPECSPLSCNSLAVEVSVNEHCLFPTFEEAKSSLESGKFEGSEPGPYRIIAVYKVGMVVPGST